MHAQSVVSLILPVVEFVQSVVTSTVGLVLHPYGLVGTVLVVVLPHPVLEQLYKSSIQTCPEAIPYLVLLFNMYEDQLSYLVVTAFNPATLAVSYIESGISLFQIDFKEANTLTLGFASVASIEYISVPVP